VSNKVSLVVILTFPWVSFAQGLNGKANVSSDLAAMVVATQLIPEPFIT